MKERQNQILKYINQNGKTGVSFLAEYFEVSGVTIRKDLDYLAERGVIKRGQGYAMPADSHSMNFNIADNYEYKQRIAALAATYIQNGETILVESGSTCALFAAEVAASRKNVTIITNSLYLAGVNQENPNINLILLGGAVQYRSKSMIGPLTKKALELFHVDKLFTGIDGYSREFGFTGDDVIQADSLRAMAAVADHTYILAASDKFYRPGAVSFLKLEDVYEVITDSRLDVSEKKYLEEKGVIVTLA